MEKDTGARALRAIIEEFMLDIMYEIPKDDNIGRVTITREYIENTGGPVLKSAVNGRKRRICRTLPGSRAYNKKNADGWHMACREQTLSNDYAEALLDYILTEDDLKGMDYCTFKLDEQFTILYFRRLGMQQPINVNQYTYNSVPKLYGLMQDEDGRTGGFDTTSLSKTGVLQVQRPPLSLSWERGYCGLCGYGNTL